MPGTLCSYSIRLDVLYQVLGVDGKTIPSYLRLHRHRHRHRPLRDLPTLRILGT